MRYLMLITYIDLADEQPRVVVRFMDAGTEDEVAKAADEFARSARSLMDLAVSEWRDEKEWTGLDGEDLLRQAGYAFGSVEVWSGERLVHVADSWFGPCDLDRYPDRPGDPLESPGRS